MIAPEASAPFVANMEDVLEVYQRPHNSKHPLVCLDETSKQLIAETRAPIPAKPGQPARHDCEYERNGVANLFMMFAPLEGWCRVKVTDRRAAVHYAHALKDLSDMHFPGADKIVLVQDKSQHAYGCVALRSLSRRRSKPPRRTIRMALHAEARKLARHGRSRARRSDDTMPEPPHSQQAGPPKRGRRLARSSQQASRQGGLAIHNRRRPRQTRKAKPGSAAPFSTSLLLSKTIFRVRRLSASANQLWRGFQ